MKSTTIKTFDGKLHYYPEFTANEVIKFLAKKGMNVTVNNPINNSEFKVVK